MVATWLPNHFCAAGCTPSATHRSSADTSGQAKVAVGDSAAGMLAVAMRWPRPTEGAVTGS